MFRNRLALALAALLAIPAALHADDTFLESDDFKDGEEVVNVFLKEPEYAIMIEEFTRNGQEFDWGWALTPGWGEQAAPADQGQGKGGLRGRLSRRSSGPKLQQNPRQLGFSLSDYQTVYVPPVANFAGIVRDDELEQVHEALLDAVKEMGLTAASSAANADLVLETALVDVNRQGGGFGYIQVDPFIEMEIRLKERATERALFLARTQKHARNAFDASLTVASQIALALR